MHALIDQARAEVENAGALIDEILFLSELESGARSSRSATRRRCPVLESVVDELADAAARAGVTLRPKATPTSTCRSGRGCCAWSRENLAENAIRYAGHGATLHALDPREPATFAVLTAADDGIGVAERDLPRLFERFYRADAARTSRGTGLGLAIVKHVVVAAGGEVEADGGRGRGLRIRARSRLSEQRREAPSGALARQPRARRA